MTANPVTREECEAILETVEVPTGYLGGPAKRLAHAYLALLAEVEELRRKLAEAGKRGSMLPDPQVTREWAQEIVNEIEISFQEFGPRKLHNTERFAMAYLKALDECENLRRDKERLDWLDSLPDQSEFTPAEYGTNIREAIDAAIRSGK